MRLWTIHPACLDTPGLLAAWREGLLAQKVLQGLTKGYTHHPQLDRFRNSPSPMLAIYLFLKVIAQDAMQRGYSFDTSRIAVPAETNMTQFLPQGGTALSPNTSNIKVKTNILPGTELYGMPTVPSSPGTELNMPELKIPVTQGQVEYEWFFLRQKLSRRSPGLLEVFDAHPKPLIHPLFTVVMGGIEPWERIK